MDSKPWHTVLHVTEDWVGGMTTTSIMEFIAKLVARLRNLSATGPTYGYCCIQILTQAGYLRGFMGSLPPTLCKVV